MNNNRNKELKLKKSIEIFNDIVKRQKQIIDQLHDPVKIQEIIDKKIAEHSEILRQAEETVAKKRLKLQKLKNREQNPPMCPVCKKAMKVGEQTITLNETQYNLDINTENKRLELHKKCRTNAEKFRINQTQQL